MDNLTLSYKAVGGYGYRDDYIGRDQTGVLRVNCVDCLDRTNTAQFIAGKWSPEENFRYYWNKTAVLLFLWNFYLVDRSDNTTSFEVLHAAWPERYRNSPIRVPRSANNDLEFNIYDIGFCLLAYLACGGLLAVLAHWLIVRRKKTFSRTLLPLR